MTFNNLIARKLIKLRYRRLPTTKNWCFIHLPKTGGASLSKYMFGEDLGHFRISRIQPALENQNIITILREPVDRFISASVFLRHHSKYRADQKTKKYLKQLTVESALQELIQAYGTTKMGIHFMPETYFLSNAQNTAPKINYIRFNELPRLSEELELPKLNRYKNHDSEAFRFQQYLQDQRQIIEQSLSSVRSSYEALTHLSTHLRPEYQSSLIREIREERKSLENQH